MVFNMKYIVLKYEYKNATMLLVVLHGFLEKAIMKTTLVVFFSLVPYITFYVLSSNRKLYLSRKIRGEG